MIEQAIRERKLMHIRYNDVDRVIEPHAYGISPKGEALLRAYQTSPEEGWKLFKVENIPDMRVVSTTGKAPRPGFKTGDKAMASIIAEIAVGA